MAAAAPAAAAPAKVQEKPTDAKAAAPAAPADPKGPRVFVGNLAFKTTSEELKAHMATASANIVTAEIIAYASGRSKGCGLVEFKSTADAAKAINQLTNTELGGRKIFVREDREPAGFGKKDGKDAAAPKPKPAGAAAAAAGAAGADAGARGGRGGRGRGRGRGRGGRGGAAAEAPARPSNSDVSNLYVGNLAWATTDNDLKQLFSDFGVVSKCQIATDRSGRSKGFATVTMAKATDAQAAINTLNDTEFHERKIVVRMDHYSA